MQDLKNQLALVVVLQTGTVGTPPSTSKRTHGCGAIGGVSACVDPDDRGSSPQSIASCGVDDAAPEVEDDEAGGADEWGTAGPKDRDGATPADSAAISMARVG